MRVEYVLPLRPGVVFPSHQTPAAMQFGNCEARWLVGPNDDAQSVTLFFQAMSLRLNENGAILPTYREIEDEAYRVAVHLGNWIYRQTGRDAIEASAILSSAPVASPENDTEVEQFRTLPKFIWATCPLAVAWSGTFDPGPYPATYRHSAAHGYFADGLRAGNVFQRYELFYKVVEYFVVDDGAKLDTAVSAYLVVLDPSFTVDAVRELRELRNKIVHPRARKGHVNPETLASVREVEQALPSLLHLVDCLLQKPTF